MYLMKKYRAPIFPLVDKQWINYRIRTVNELVFC